MWPVICLLNGILLLQNPNLLLKIKNKKIEWLQGFWLFEWCHNQYMKIYPNITCFLPEFSWYIQMLAATFRQKEARCFAKCIRGNTLSFYIKEPHCERSHFGKIWIITNFWNMFYRNLDPFYVSIFFNTRLEIPIRWVNQKCMIPIRSTPVE